MKRMLQLVLLFTLTLLIVSCSSFSDLVRSQVEGLPSWIYNPTIRNDQVAFVGRGSAPVPYNARLAAYEDILSQISEYVGQSVRDTYYRELTTTNAVSDLGLTISNEFERTDNRAQTQIYLLARANANLLAGKRTSLYNEMLERDAAITALIAEADRAYRANDDITAINKYLEAAILASKGPVTDKRHELDTLLSRAQTFLEALRFQLRDADQKTATVTVILQRKGRLLSPRVLKAPIRASYSARNSLGIEYSDFLQFNTANSGFFVFVPYNQGLVREGGVRFSLDFSAMKSKLLQALGEEKALPILDAMDACAITFDYALKSRYADTLILSEIQEFNEDGVLLTSTHALTTFQREFALDGVSVIQENFGIVDVEEQLSQLSERYRTGLALLGSVGVAQREQIRSDTLVVVSGRIHVYDLATGTLLYDTQDVEAVASSPSGFDEARSEAFRRFGSISSYLVGAYLFRR